MKIHVIQPFCPEKVDLQGIASPLIETKPKKTDTIRNFFRILSNDPEKLPIRGKIYEVTP